MVFQALWSAVDALQPWLHGLWKASWQGALWAALAWAVTRALPRLPSAVRAGLWWLVSLKFLVSLVGLTPVPLPLLPSSSREPAPVVAPAPAPPVLAEATPMRLSLDGDGPLLKGGVVLVESARSLGMMMLVFDGVLALLLVAWALGAAWQVRGHLKSHAAVRRLRREARPLHHPELEAAVRTLATEAGLRRVPALYVSDAVASPLAVGLLRPRIILPERAVRRLPVEALTMALAHELAHVRRGDLWLGWVPALAEAVLFFHPLARLAVREYALAREESCDAEALRLTGAEPGDYGQLLLVFGIARAHGPAAAHGASPHLHALHRRLNMLEFVDVSRPRTLLRGALGFLGLVALVPFQVVAREPVSPAVSVTPAVLTSPAEPVMLAQAQPAKPAPAAPAAPPAPAVKATPPTAPKAPTPPERINGRIHLHDDDDGESYILTSGDNTIMSGSTRDLERVRVLREGGKDLLWVRRDGKEYVIRDPETLKQVRASFDMPRELGEQQAALGQKQAALGQQQAEIGRKQAEIGHQQAQLGVKQAELAREQADLAVLHARMAATRDEAEQERLEKELEPKEEALDKRRDALSAQMDALSEKMEPLSDEMEALGEKQEDLGDEQQELGHKMRRVVREAERKLSSLVDEALKKGLAEPVKS